ncbi:MAG: U32 family peptidase, partial [Anaeroplasmataceae bacterium]
VNFIYSDIGVHTLLKKHNMEFKGVYDPVTTITNSKEFGFFIKNYMKACSISLEITMNDIEKIVNTNPSKAWCKVFGYQQMFYSRRKLLSLYKEHSNIDAILSNANTYLKEETRDEYYHAVENEHGTVLFRNYIISFLKEKEILKNVGYIFLDSLFLEETDFIIIVKTYLKYLNGLITLEKAIEAIDNLELQIEEGFMYEDSVYQKENTR